MSGGNVCTMCVRGRGSCTYIAITAVRTMELSARTNRFGVSLMNMHGVLRQRRNIKQEMRLTLLFKFASSFSTFGKTH